MHESYWDGFELSDFRVEEHPVCGTILTYRTVGFDGADPFWDVDDREAIGLISPQQAEWLNGAAPWWEFSGLDWWIWTADEPEAFHRTAEPLDADALLDLPQPWREWASQLTFDAVRRGVACDVLQRTVALLTA